MMHFLRLVEGTDGCQLGAPDATEALAETGAEDMASRFIDSSGMFDG